ncbi:MAG: N-formylglutamate amidohydrolase [Clostridiales bacterium]|nr:N-formylglutamate amidohydrolase [Clostridiales bacterium]
MILHIPHSNTTIPKEHLQDYTDKLHDLILEKTDWFTNDLFSHWNSDLVIFPYSRLFCDVERFKDDALNQIGQGILYTKDNAGNLLRVLSQQAKKDAESLYDNHHELLNKKASRALSLFPEVFVVDCHSFTPSPGDPDICIGTNADYITKNVDVQNVYNDIIDLLKSHNYAVEINVPFQGSIVPTNHIGNPNMHPIMIEVNKTLYMTGGKKNKDFEKIQDVINQCLEIISKYEISKDI